MSIQTIDAASVHRLTSGQVVTDLQTAVKELVENSLDAKATSIEVRFKQYGVVSIEVIDNGTGIAPADYDSVALKHHTSKLAAFEDLATVRTFGFRGEALASLCGLCESVVVTTATEHEAPMGTILEFDSNGRVKSRSGKAARQRGTTVTLTKLFAPLPVRRKDLEKNAKREYGKALSLLQAYALVPCTNENGGVRLTVTNQLETSGRKQQLQVAGNGSLASAMTSLWGPKAMENMVAFEISFDVQPERSAMKRNNSEGPIRVQMKGIISKFIQGSGRPSSDRQYIFVNGRPCSLTKILRAINETYKTFNVTQVPAVIVDCILPTANCDVNVSPDKRTIFLHREQALIAAMKDAMSEHFTPTQSTFQVQYTLNAAQVDLNSESDEDEAPKDDAMDTNEDATQLDDLPPPPPPPTTATKLGLRNSAAAITATRDSSRASLASSKEAQGESQQRDDHEDSAIEGSSSDSVQSTVLPEPPSLPSPPIAVSTSQAASASPNPSTPVRSRSPTVPLDPTPRSPPPAPASKPDHKAAPPTQLSSWAKLLTSDVASGSRKRGRGASDDESTPQARPALPFDAFRIPKKRKQASPERDLPKPVSPPKLARRSVSSEVEMIDIDIDALDPATATRGSRTAKSSVPEKAKMKLEPKEQLQTPQPVKAATRRRNVPSQPAVADIIDLTQDDDESSDYMLPATSSSAPGWDEPLPDNQSDVDIWARVDIDALVAAWHHTIDAPTQKAGVSLADDSGAGVDADQEDAEETLSRTIHKGDFARMEVLGQFNLGFIIARLRHRASAATSRDSNQGSRSSDAVDVTLDDLFIIDQHASDERYNFETLQATTKMETQKLLRPRRLELTAADEIIAMDRAEIIKSNGFELSIDEDAPVNQRVQLTAMPVSKNTTFDVKDLEELLGLLRVSASDEMVRCSKVRSMFAMRACRKSVMIGHPLNMRQMKEIVRHMGEHKGWTCPHGRPTMRHLFSLGGVVPPAPTEINWDAFIE